MQKFSIGVLLLFGCTQASNELTVLTSGDNPPYEMHRTEGTHELVGFDIELMVLLGQQLGRPIRWQEVTFDGVVAGLAGRRAEAAIAALTPTAERRKSVDFSRPYYQAKPVLLVRKASSSWLAEGQWAGKTVGAQLGSTHERSLKSWQTLHPVLQVTSLPNVGDLVQELRLGRLDGVLVEPAVALGYSKIWPELIHQNIAELEGEEAVAIAFPKGSTLLPKIDAALRSLEQAGTLKALQCKWLEGCP